MKTRWIGVAAIALVACASPTWAARNKHVAPEKTRAETLTASAWAALGKGDAQQAIRDAEAATLILPYDASTRALLGRAYLAGGRFASAETAFGDALSLDPTLRRLSVNRALAQIALGHETAARASLASAEGVASEADIGLALALLGDTDTARDRLYKAASTTDADARTRQNLGLVFALEGRWDDAAAVAGQDVPADMLPQRLRRWSTIAQLKADPAMQIGAILGVMPAADGGLPDALALSAPAVPVVMAEAPASSPPFVPLVAPIVREEGNAVVTAVTLAPPPLDQLASIPALPAQTILASLAPEPVAAPDEPKVASWAGPPLMRKARIEQPGIVKMVHHAKPVATGPVVLASWKPKAVPPRSSGDWAVQLGAFSSSRRTEIAWGKLSGRAAYLSAYTPTGSGKRWGKAMLYRLSVSGLPSRKDAISLCVRIRSSGGACFVRRMSGEQPMTWALRSRTTEPA